MKTPLLVGIAGGTASGKTSLARKLQAEVGEKHSILLELDSYYEELSHLPMEERAAVNFDHPSAFDWALLESCLSDLMQDRPVEVPVYDYASHNRGPKPRRVAPRPLIILEGILVFWNSKIRDMMDIRVFVDTPDDLRLLRRLRRDIAERDRSVESVLEQYETRVRPMHIDFCEPTKVHADVIIPRGGLNQVALDLVCARLRDLLGCAEETN